MKYKYITSPLPFLISNVSHIPPIVLPLEIIFFFFHHYMYIIIISKLLIYNYIDIILSVYLLLLFIVMISGLATFTIKLTRFFMPGEGFFSFVRIPKFPLVLCLCVDFSPSMLAWILVYFVSSYLGSHIIEMPWVKFTYHFYTGWCHIRSFGHLALTIFLAPIQRCSLGFKRKNFVVVLSTGAWKSTITRLIPIIKVHIKNFIVFSSKLQNTWKLMNSLLP